MTKLFNWGLVRGSHLLLYVKIIYSHGTDFDSPIVTSVGYYFCTYQVAIERHLIRVAFGFSFGPSILFIAIVVASTICLLLPTTNCIIVVIVQPKIIVARQVAEVQDSSTVMPMTKTVPL